MSPSSPVFRVLHPRQSLRRLRTSFQQSSSPSTIFTGRRPQTPPQRNHPSSSPSPTISSRPTPTSLHSSSGFSFETLALPSLGSPISEMMSFESDDDDNVYPRTSGVHAATSTRRGGRCLATSGWTSGIHLSLDEEERLVFANEIIDLVEPRPQGLAVAVRGIEEVLLDGSILI